MTRAKVTLHTAQAQKAFAQAREIDMRTGTTVPKVALEAMAQRHNQNLDQAKHHHQVSKDAVEQIIKGVQAKNQHRLSMTNTMQKGTGALGGFGGPAADDGQSTN